MTIVNIDNFDTFKRIVENNEKSFMMSKVFVSESNTAYEFAYADNVWTYRCVVSKDSIIDINSFKVAYVDSTLKGKI